METEIHDASETDEGQPVMYEELAALEQEFDDVDVEIREYKPIYSIHSFSTMPASTNRPPSTLPTPLRTTRITNKPTMQSANKPSS